MICGVDEVGRGAFAGPLMAVAALFSCEFAPVEGIKDSKRFSSKKARKKVFDKILACPELVDFGIGQIDPEEIDTKGVNWANDAAMGEAVKSLTRTPTIVIVDGNNAIGGLPEHIYQRVEPKADRNRWQVAAASILAKVIRDDYMAELANLTGFSCWVTCSGYGTKAHIEAIRALGITEYHRKTFVKVSV